MGQVVIVFNFPEPENNVELGLIIAKAKELFADKEDLKVHMAIKDAADSVMAVFDTTHVPDGNLVEHAKRELDLIGDDGDGFNQAIIAAVRGFSSYGHSGGSAAVGVSMVTELLQFHNLSPLTNNPKEWFYHTEDVAGPGGVWQNARRGEAFSTDGGKTYYLLSEGGTMHNPEPVHFSAEYSEV